jgi:uncharacterized membrane protein YqjE
MNWHDAALGMAGVIGSGVAVVHGVLVQRLMVKPLNLLLAERRVAAPVRKLVPPLLHFSTFAWFLGGLALIAAVWLDPETRLAAGLFVGALYVFGVIGNFWATRGRHPGWMLLAASLVLIALGVTNTGM